MKTWMKWAIGALVALLIIGVVYVKTQTPAITHTKTITLVVASQPGDFTIDSLDVVHAMVGETAGFTVDVSPLKGFSRPVKFTVTGGPAGTTIGWQPPGDTWTPDMAQTNLVCEVTIPLDNSLAGNYPLTLTGTAQ